MNENDVPMEFTIRPITVESKAKVLAFMKRYFFRDEPLNDSLDLIDENNSTCVELEEYSTASLDENLSFMAVSPTGAIVGVIINGTTEAPCKEEEPEYIRDCKNPKFRKILKLLHFVDQKIDIEKRYPDTKSLDIRIVSVDSNWRGKGIASALFKKTLETAKELNYDMTRTDCSSHFTAKLCQRLGFEPILELKYSEYTDDDGKPILTPSPPHNSILTYIRKL